MVELNYPGRDVGRSIAGLGNHGNDMPGRVDSY